MIAVLRVSSSETLLGLMTCSNGSAKQLVHLRYWFCFRGMAFEPITYHSHF
jgi:hypothetical protein